MNHKTGAIPIGYIGAILTCRSTSGDFMGVGGQAARKSLAILASKAREAAAKGVSMPLAAHPYTLTFWNTYGDALHNAGEV